MAGGQRKGLPRGLKGREPTLPRTRWSEPDELPPKDWVYSSASSGLFLGYRKGRALGWKEDRHPLTVASGSAHCFRRGAKARGRSFVVVTLNERPNLALGKL